MLTVEKLLKLFYENIFLVFANMLTLQPISEI